RHAGVAAQDLEPPVALDVIGGRRFDRRRVGDVQRHRFGAAAGGGDLVHRCAGVIAARRGDHQGALRSEARRDRAADAARRTGHERYLAGELEHDYVVRAAGERAPRAGPIVSSTARRSSGVLNATAVDLRWILRTRPLSTAPGPTSTYVVTPSNARRVTTASQRTGDDTCCTSASIAATASRFNSASTLATIGTVGVLVRSARSSGASRSCAGFISAQWNGALTGSGITRRAPRALARPRAGATAAAMPAITTCPPPLRFAGLTPAPSAASAHARATCSASRPRIAAIAPSPAGTASCM